MAGSWMAIVFPVTKLTFNKGTLRLNGLLAAVLYDSSNALFVLTYLLWVEEIDVRAYLYHKRQ